MRCAHAVIRKLLTIAAAGLLVLSSVRLPAFAAEPADYAAEILERRCGGMDMQSYCDMLPESSSGDWYLMTLADAGYDLSTAAELLTDKLTNTQIASASTRERYALALAACCETPPAVCSEILDSSAEGLGIMSRIFALHLLNNGVPSAVYTNAELADMLLAMQADDGGWSLQGSFGDPDVTAMTLQALAPYRDEPEIAGAVGRALDYLSAAQLPSGAYMSYGVENPESTAQVWLALHCLGIDGLSDARFLADGHSLLDGILQFRLSEGEYAHMAGGAANEMAATQVFLALTAAQRPAGDSLFLFHGAAPVLSRPAATEPPPPGTSAAAAPQTEPTQAAADVPAEETTAETVPETQTDKTTASATTVTSDTTTQASDETTATTTTMTGEGRSAGVSGRVWLTVAAVIAACAAVLVCILRKKRRVGHYLSIAVLLGLALVGIWCIRIERPDTFYSAAPQTGGGTVTLEIRCDAICGMAGSEAFPADGVLLPETVFSIAEGETVLELLYDAVRQEQMQVEVDGITGTAYVRGIASLYEFDFGELAGWCYAVNGSRPAVGCGAYTLTDGDRVVWTYTLTP